jgi:hypothetical protein
MTLEELLDASNEFRPPPPNNNAYLEAVICTTVQVSRLPLWHELLVSSRTGLKETLYIFHIHR